MSRKWIYGKQDWKTFERGQENCYLMTNGLGGFSSLTATGSAARNDHAFFMAALRAPNSRYNMIHRLRESLGTEGGESSSPPRSLRTEQGRKDFNIWLSFPMKIPRCGNF